MPLMGRVPLGYSAERWLSACEKLNTHILWVCANIGVLITRPGRGLRGKLRRRNGGTEAALYAWLKRHDIRPRGRYEAGRKLDALDAIMGACCDSHLQVLRRKHGGVLGLPSGEMALVWGQVALTPVASPRRGRPTSPLAGPPAKRGRVGRLE